MANFNDKPTTKYQLIPISDTMDNIIEIDDDPLPLMENTSTISTNVPDNIDDVPIIDITNIFNNNCQTIPYDVTAQNIKYDGIIDITDTSTHTKTEYEIFQPESSGLSTVEFNPHDNDQIIRSTNVDPTQIETIILTDDSDEEKTKHQPTIKKPKSFISLNKHPKDSFKRKINFTFKNHTPIANTSTSQLRCTSPSKLEYASTSKLGCTSTSKLGYASTSKLGYASTSKLGYASTSKLGYASTSQLGNTSTSQQGNTSTSQLGNTSTSKLGCTSTSKLGCTSTSKLGYASTSKLGHTSTSKLGHTSTSKLGHTSTSKLGHTSTSKLGYASTSKLGYTSTSKLGHMSTSKLECTSTSKLGYASTSKLGYTSTSKLECTSTSKLGYASTFKRGCTTTSKRGCTSTSKLGYTSTSKLGYTSTSKLGYTSTSKLGYTSTSKLGYTSTPKLGYTSTPKLGYTSTSNLGCSLNSGAIISDIPVTPQNYRFEHVREAVATTKQPGPSSNIIELNTASSYIMETNIPSSNTVSSYMMESNRALLNTASLNTASSNIALTNKASLNTAFLNTASSNTTLLNTASLITASSNTHSSNTTEVTYINPRPIIIDGLNIGHKHGNGTFSAKGIDLCIQYFAERGHTNIIAFMPEHRQGPTGSDSHTILNKLVKQGHICLTPSRKIENMRMTCYDDRILLNYASKCNGVVVSNDYFRDLYNESEEFKDIINNRQVMVTFVKDEIIVPEDQYNYKYGFRSLSEILSFP